MNQKWRICTFYQPLNRTRMFFMLFQRKIKKNQTNFRLIFQISTADFSIDFKKIIKTELLFINYL